ncbi:MAG: secondary thiamine-phosphate synthase enzyme YjbQ [Candidatus Woesearchaeota archaeon]|nr:secondary thiamine-phosphate synthase enzyme YjbQ [Candidatus Woesearchaeota archaeon]
MSTFALSTKRKQQVINITAEVHDIVRAAGVKDGLCIVQSLHTTAGIFCNVTEDLEQDIFKVFDTLAPDDNYNHNKYDPNAEAHLKKIIMGRTVTLTITNGTVDLGTWEKIQFAEFDGPRERTVHVKVL